MANESIWSAVAPPFEEFPVLDKEIKVKIAIIGAGITGLTAALNLMDEESSVAVVESNSIGSGTTGNSTGNLYVLVQPYYYTLEAKYGIEITKTIAQSRKLAIDFIEATVRDENIDCHFSRRPSYLFTNNEKSINHLKKETQILKNCGIAIEEVKELPIPVSFKYASLLPDQGRFNPLTYVRGLAKTVKKKGGLIFENSPVLSINEGNICKITTEKGIVFAEKVIIATHSSKGIDKFSFLLGPYRSYVIAAKLKEGYPNGHFWDYDNYTSSTHATRSKDLDAFLVAGSHHKTGQGKNHEENFSKLQSYLSKIYDVEEIGYQWSAQHYQSADEIPYIGLHKTKYRNIYNATGYFADGLVYGTVSGILIADLLLQRKNPWVDVYNPSRLNILKSAKKAISENTNNLLQYLKDFPQNVSAKDFNQVKENEGKTIEIHGEKYGAYRDEEGKLHVVSAVCTHMKCILHWNNTETTWDCPCHGSRFTIEGKVIEGPALTNLEQYNTKKRN